MLLSPETVESVAIDLPERQVDQSIRPSIDLNDPIARNPTGRPVGESHMQPSATVAEDVQFCPCRQPAIESPGVFVVVPGSQFCPR